MASTGVIFFDKNQQMFKTPQEATRSDLAAVLGQVGEGESLATGIAQKLLDNRTEIEEIFAQHDRMLSEAGMQDDVAMHESNDNVTVLQA